MASCSPICATRVENVKHKGHPQIMAIFCRINAYSCRVGAALLCPPTRNRLMKNGGHGNAVHALHGCKLPILYGSAAAFYRSLGFVPSVTESRHLFMLIMNIVAAAGA